MKTTWKQRALLRERLKQARLARGWSQMEVALRLNYSQQAISKYEGGSKRPSLEMMVELEKVLQTEPGHFTRVFGWLKVEAEA